MLKATCDDILMVYFDGIQQFITEDETTNWEKVSKLIVPDATKTLAFHCKDNGLGYGLLALMEVYMGQGSGAVYTMTDTDWTCSAVEESGWETPGFQETSNWKKAIDSGEPGDRSGVSNQAKWIWSDSAYRDVYCRQDIDIISFVKSKRSNNISRYPWN